MLEQSEEKIRSFAVAKQLGVSKPAVTKAMASLQDMGLIEKTSYSDITLTTKGREQASIILNKHNLIKDFLIKIGVDSETASVDCCKIEHVLSSETLVAIQKFLKK